MNGRKNDYNDDKPEVRKAALVNFWNKMQSDPDLRRACTNTENVGQAMAAGRAALKEAGNFKDDPNGIDGVEVRVYESIRPTADKIVTIVIPEEFNPNAFDPEKFWRCSWNLWKPTMLKKPTKKPTKLKKK